METSLYRFKYLSIKTTHGKEENWSLFTGGLYSEGQFYIHWTKVELIKRGKGYLLYFFRYFLVNSNYTYQWTD